MMRYRRKMYFDYNSNSWHTFYTNHDNKIVLSKKMNYTTALKIVKKNYNYSSHNDKILKKDSIKKSEIIKNKLIYQKIIDKKLKNFSKLSNKEKINLKNDIDNFHYKTKDFNEKIKHNKKLKKIIIEKIDKKDYNSGILAATYFFSTSPHFYINPSSFKLLKHLSRQSYMSSFTDFYIEIDDLSGTIRKKDFKNIETFETAMEFIVADSQLSKTDFIRDQNLQFMIKGIKR